MTAQFTLGKILSGDNKRDALHIAVAPVEAACLLYPGQHVGLNADGKADKDAKAIGIVDPFLTAQVHVGAHFWLVLYPNSITSLQHNWTHPAFTGEAAPVTSESEKWLRDYARCFEISYDGLLRACREYVERGDWHVLHFDTPSEAYTQSAEMWRHFEAVTGIRFDEARRHETPFTRSC